MSNAYIASDDESLMKVGKANDPKRREREIALPMTVTIACLDEAAALRVESQLRQFVIEQGGIRHQNTIDWFKFDPQIYAILCEFAGGLDGFKAVPVLEKDLDQEIAELQARYFRLLTEEYTKLIRENEEERERLHSELNRERTEKERYIMEAGKWKALAEFYQQMVKDKDKDE